MVKEYTSRLPVTFSKELDFNTSEVWSIIPSPGHLNLFHPFCKSNEAIQWNGEHSDQLIYINERNYIRKFQTWEEGKGFTLLIGDEGGPQSYVVWKLESLQEQSRLTITVYPYILAKLPNFMAYIPHITWVKPRLQKYLYSVLTGLEYHLQTGKTVPRNHFGKHPWFSSTKSVR